MDRAEFESSMRRDGYEIVTRDWASGTSSPDHTHAFDARLFITSGRLILTIGGEARSYGVGETCAVPAGTVHAEACGPDGVSLLAARRMPAA